MKFTTFIPVLALCGFSLAAPSEPSASATTTEMSTLAVWTEKGEMMPHRVHTLAPTPAVEEHGIALCANEPSHVTVHHEMPAHSKEERGMPLCVNEPWHMTISHGQPGGVDGRDVEGKKRKYTTITVNPNQPKIKASEIPYGHSIIYLTQARQPIVKRDVAAPTDSAPSSIPGLATTFQTIVVPKATETVEVTDKATGTTLDAAPSVTNPLFLEDPFYLPDPTLPKLPLTTDDFSQLFPDIWSTTATTTTTTATTAATSTATLDLERLLNPFIEPELPEPTWPAILTYPISRRGDDDDGGEPAEECSPAWQKDVVRHWTGNTIGMEWSIKQYCGAKAFDTRKKSECTPFATNPDWCEIKSEWEKEKEEQEKAMEEGGK